MQIYYTRRKADHWVRKGMVEALGKLRKKQPHVAFALLKLAREKDDLVQDAAYNALKEVAGNLRYAELDNGQKRIKRTERKELQRTRAKQTDRRTRRKRKSAR